jgi:hypothetical protein
MPTHDKIQASYQTYLRAFTFAVLGWNTDEHHTDFPEFKFWERENTATIDARALALGVAQGVRVRSGKEAEKVFPLGLKEFCQAYGCDFYETMEGRQELREKAVEKGTFCLKMVYPQVLPLSMVIKDLRERFETELMNFLQRRLYPTLHDGKPVPYDLDVRDLPDDLYALYNKDPDDFKRKLETGEITFVPKSYQRQHPDGQPKTAHQPERTHPHAPLCPHREELRKTFEVAALNPPGGIRPQITRVALEVTGNEASNLREATDDDSNLRKPPGWWVDNNEGKKQ